VAAYDGSLIDNGDPFMAAWERIKFAKLIFPRFSIFVSISNLEKVSSIQVGNIRYLGH
jgi:hypothetical protein